MPEYNTYEGYFARARNRYFARVIERCIPKDAIVVDLGCGQGDFLNECRTAGRDARGFDLLEKWASYCRSQGLRAERANVLEGVPLPDASVDVVFAQSVLEHVEPNAFLREISRVLRPGGRCILSAPTPEHQFWDDPTHVRPYTIKAIETLFAMFDYDVIHTNYVFAELLGMRLTWNKLYQLLNLVPVPIGSNVLVVGEKRR